MKRQSKRSPGQFKLGLYQEPPLQFDESRKKELRDVLADLLLEALGGKASASEGKKDNVDES